jgi:hypothetical protein
VAHDDATTTGPATPVSLAVLGNDDLGAAPTTITTHSVADHGSVTCSATECTYVPGAGFSGTVGSGSEARPLTAAVDGNRVAIDIGPEGTQQHVTFARAEGSLQTTAPVPTATAGQRNVVINGQRLSDSELASAEQTHRIHIPDANYWYDVSIGAWGAQGGPTLGFIAPGLTLAGTLQPNASGGGTGVFVNGRELHAVDVQRLNGLVGNVIPGRWWVDAQGNFGPEGWPMVGNLFMLARARLSGGGAVSSEVVSQSGWLVSDGSGFIGFQGSIGSGVSASSGG